jgi:hypothetical protein
MTQGRRRAVNAAPRRIRPRRGAFERGRLIERETVGGDAEGGLRQGQSAAGGPRKGRVQA